MISPTEVGLLMMAGLLVLLFIGMPIAFSLGLIGLAGLAATRGLPSLTFLAGNFPYSATAELGLIIIPLFLFMGHLAFSAGLSSRAYTAARSWVGHVPGGLAMATVYGCAGFATVSGSSVATAATMAKVAVPEMLNAGYSARLAAGCVAAGGTLGVLIPPSGILVIYSIATGVSLSELLIAAVVPGVLTALLYALGIAVMVRRDPSLVPTQRPARASWRERTRSLLGAWEAGLLFLLVMGSIYLGVATPTEAAAVGAAVALLIAFARTRGDRGALGRGLIETGTTTASIFALIVGAGLFGLALATTQIPQDLAEWVGTLGLGPTTLLICLLLPYLVLGAFIDGLSMILLTMPVVYPIIEQAGIDPVLFGILVTKMTEIGAITPPVGLNVFVVQGAVPELNITDAFRGAAPFVVIEGVVVLLLIFVPILTLGFIR
ncbi:MAG: TRAP transporter large permease [Burkholderiaceae bacterium]